MFHKKSCSEKFCNIHKKTIVLKSLFDKVAGLQPCNFTEKRFQHRCFPVHANGCFGLIFYFSNLYVFGCLLTITNKNKRSDKRFNSRGYSLFFLMCIFLNHLWLIPNISKWQDCKIFTKLVPSETLLRS